MHMTKRLLVPVNESATFRNTVAYAVRQAAESDRHSTVYFVYPLSQRQASADRESGRSLLDRIEVWAREDVDDEESVTVETALIGEEEYLFSPADYARVLSRYASDHDLETVLLDPELNFAGTTPLLPPLAAELRRNGLTVEEAPVERPARRTRLVRHSGAGQFVLLAGLSFGFYLLVGGTLSTFDLATGAISAVIVATVLHRISLTGPVDLRTLAARVVRMAVYTPYLLWEIAKANVLIAYVILHPRMPIDPKMVEFDAALWSELQITTLANSITLTPGTLSVNASRQRLVVHTLTRSSREDLLDGALERAVRFVFYGRSAARIPGPRERGDTVPRDTETETEDRGEAS